MSAAASGPGQPERGLLVPRLGWLSQQRMQDAVDAWGGGPVTGLRPAPNGNWGRTVLVSTEEQELVFKAAPAPFTGLDVEAGCARLLASAGLPVPDPTLFDDTATLFAWPYLVMPRLCGLDWEDEQLQGALTDDDRMRIAAEMGRLLARTQERRWGRPGKVDACGVRLSDDPYLERTRRSVASTLAGIEAFVIETSRRDVALSGDDRRLIADVLRDATHAPPPGGYALALTDFHERNVVCQEVDGCWLPTGMFDLDGHVGDPLASLPRIVAVYRDESERCEAAFVAAYCDSIDVGSGAHERYRLYALADRLEIWLFAHSSRDLWWEPGTPFREWVAGYLVPPDLP